MHLARLGHGIFRRFLRYVRMCIETCMPFEEFNGQLIYLRHAKGPVDPKEVRKDRGLELSGIFKREETKRLADRIIETLHKDGEKSQKALAESLNVSEAAVSRILDPLEGYSFVERVRSGQEKLVRARV